MMDESQLQKLETLVKHHATNEARGYYLKHSINGRYPNTGFFMLDPFEAPEAAPSGDYQVFYTRHFAADSPVLPAHGPNPVVSLTNPGSEATTKGQQKEREKEQGQLAPKAAQKATWMDDPAYVKLRLELEAERHAHEMQENKLLIGKKVRLSAENAEYIVLARAMRHELQQAYQMQNETQRANLQLLGELQARLVDLITQKGSTAQPQSSSWFSPELLTLGTSLVKSFLGKGDEDAVNATILEKKKKELTQKRDEAKAKLRSLEKSKKKKKKAEPKKPAARKAKAPRAVKVKGQLAKGEQP